MGVGATMSEPLCQAVPKVYKWDTATEVSCGSGVIGTRTHWFGGCHKAVCMVCGHHFSPISMPCQNKFIVKCPYKTLGVIIKFDKQKMSLLATLNSFLKTWKPFYILYLYDDDEDVILRFFFIAKALHGQSTHLQSTSTPDHLIHCFSPFYIQSGNPKVTECFLLLAPD